MTIVQGQDKGKRSLRARRIGAELAGSLDVLRGARAGPRAVQASSSRVLPRASIRALSGHEGVQKNFDVLFDGSRRSIDYQMLAIPRVVFAQHYILPCRQLQSGNFG